MQYIFVAISYLGAVGGMIVLKSLDLGLGLTAAGAVLLILNAIYSLARIKPKNPEAGKAITN